VYVNSLSERFSVRSLKRACFVQGVYPSHHGDFHLQDNRQMLCLDALLSFVERMASRSETVGVEHSIKRRCTENRVQGLFGAAKVSRVCIQLFTFLVLNCFHQDLPSSKRLSQDKEYKRILFAGTTLFNAKPKDGLKYLQDHGLVDPRDARGLATFLKSNPRFDKKMLGEFLSRAENLAVLRAFIELFDYKGKIIADAWRKLLETFRLPGESQQIERIAETFSSVYFATEPGNLVCFIHTYSRLLLTSGCS
jgi:brefeldin A-resistance guanine nucleotide exchange factor 1